MKNSIYFDDISFYFTEVQDLKDIIEIIRVNIINFVSIFFVILHNSNLMIIFENYHFIFMSYCEVLM